MGQGHVCFLLPFLLASALGTADAPHPVVLNEIHYHPLETDSGGEFVELFNTGNHTIDLSRWRLEGGIQFTFPVETEIPPGGFLVVAKSPEALLRIHPGIASQILGRFEGKLSNAGETLALLDDRGEQVDKVDYDDEPPWPTRADGEGSSLERIDSRLDASPPSNWQASAPGGSPGKPNGDIHNNETVRILEVGQAPIVPRAGEGVKIEVSLSAEPPTGEVYLFHRPIPTGRNPIISEESSWSYATPDLLDATELAHWTTLEFDDSSWSTGKPNEMKWEEFQNQTILMRHRFSLRDPPRIDGLAFECTGQADAEVHLNGTWVHSYHKHRAIPFRTVDLSASEWLLESTNVLCVSLHLGDILADPGSIELRSIDPLPPPMDFRSIRLEKSSPVIVPSGDARYWGTLPAQDDSALLEYYVETYSASGSPVRFPPKAPEANAYIRFDQRDYPQGVPLYRVILAPGDLRTLRNRDPRSDSLLNATFIADGRAYHNLGFRLRGNVSRLINHKGYRMDFSKEFPFEGMTELNLNGLSVAHQALAWAIADSMELPTPKRKIVDLVLNDAFFPRYLQIESIDNDLIRRCFGEEEGGNLYKAVIEGDLSYRGENPSVYRRYYEKKTNRTRQDYSDLINLARAIAGATSAESIAGLERIIDLNQWAKFFAFHTILANEEGGLQLGSGDDYFLYRGNRTGKFQLLPWDLDTTFRQPSYPVHGQTLPAIRRIFHNQRVIQKYYAEILAELKSLDHDPGIQETLGQLRETFDERAIQELEDFLVARKQFLERSIPQSLVVDPDPGWERGETRSIPPAMNLFELHGHADVSRTVQVRVNGATAEWDSLSGGWHTLLELPPGEHDLQVSAYDESGDVCAATSVRVIRGLPRGATESVPARRLSPQTQEDRNLPVFSIELPESDLWDPTTGIHANPLQRGREWTRLGKVSLDNSEGTIFQTGAGIALDGFMGRYLEKKNFRIDFSSRYGEPDVFFPLTRNSQPEAFRSLVLEGEGDDSFTDYREGYRNNWTLLRNAVMADLFAQTCDYIPQRSLVELRLNGKTWGLYWLTEPLDGPFLEKRTGLNAFDQVGFSGLIETLHGDRGGWNRSLNLLKDLDLSVPRNSEAALQEIDLDNWVSHLILGLWSGAVEWPHRNLSFLRGKREGEKWKLIPGSMSHCLGQPVGIPFDSDTFQHLFVGHSQGKEFDWSIKPFRELCRSTEFRESFLARLELLCGTTLNPENVIRIIDRLAGKMEAYVSLETDRWGSAPSVWKRNVETLRAFAAKRCEILPSQAARFFDQPPQPSKMATNSLGEKTLPCKAKPGPPGTLFLRSPRRAIFEKALILTAEIHDSSGSLCWNVWDETGEILVRPMNAGVEDKGSAYPIRFFNGVGTARLSLGCEGPARLAVSFDGLFATKEVSVAKIEAGYRYLTGVLAESDLEWRSGDGLIMLTGETVVPQHQTLRIHPGTLVMMGADAAVRVEGSVEALGTAEDPVVVFPADERAPWLHFEHQIACDPSVFENVYFTGGGTGLARSDLLEHCAGPVFRFFGGGARFVGCVFADNVGKGIVTHGTDEYRVEDCLFTRLPFGAEFHANVAVIKNSRFVDLHTGGDDQDCLYFWGPGSNHEVDGCIFAGCGDDCLDTNLSPVQIFHSLFTGAQDKAISFFGSRSKVEDCLFVANQRGIVAKPSDDLLRIVGCTFAHQFDQSFRIWNFTATPGVSPLRAVLERCVFTGNPYAIQCDYDPAEITLIDSLHPWPNTIYSGTDNTDPVPRFSRGNRETYILEGRRGWQGFPAIVSSSSE